MSERVEVPTYYRVGKTVSPASSVVLDLQKARQLCELNSGGTCIVLHIPCNLGANGKCDRPAGTYHLQEKVAPYAL